MLAEAVSHVRESVHTHSRDMGDDSASLEVRKHKGIAKSDKGA